MREPRAFAELETKIEQEEKPAQKPNKDNYVIFKEGDAFKGTPRSNFDAKVRDASKVQDYPDFKTHDQVRDYLIKYGKGKTADDFEYEGLETKTDLPSISQSQKPTSKPKGMENAYKDALAQFPKIEETIAKTYPKGTDEYKTFDSQFLTGVLSGYLPTSLESDQAEQVEKEFAKYLYSKGYKDVSNNPIVKYEENADPKIAKKAKYVIDNYPEFFDERTYDLVERDGRYFLYNPTSEKEEEITAKELADIYDQTMSEGAPSGNQLQDELQGLVADLKATSQAQKEPLEYDERFLEDATGYLTKSLDEQGKAEINRQFKEMLDKAGFKNITPGAEAVQSANAKQSSLSQYFGGEEYKPTDWDKDVFANAAGEEYYVATPEEAREKAKEEVRAFIDDQGVQGFSDQFKDWALASAVNDDFLKQLRDEEVDYYRGEGETETADSIANMSDEDLLQYYIDSLGEKEFFDIINKNNGWDIDYIIEKAIEWDGVAHFLAYYDGDEIELPNGLYAYRLN